MIYKMAIIALHIYVFPRVACFIDNVADTSKMIASAK
jgi:hypothetical protein